MNESGPVVAQDVAEDEVLNATFTSVFTSETAVQGSQRPGKSLEQGRHAVGGILKQNRHIQVCGPWWVAPTSD